MYVSKIIFALGYLIPPAYSLVLKLNALGDDGLKNLPPAVIVTNSSFILGGLLYILMLEASRRYGAITSGTLTMFWVWNNVSFWFYFTTAFKSTCWGMNEDCPTDLGKNYLNNKYSNS